jgi:hypothetical protein
LKHKKKNLGKYIVSFRCELHVRRLGCQIRRDGGRLLWGQMVDGRVAAAVGVVRRVVDNTEHEQVHRAQVQQQETAYKKTQNMMGKLSE